MAEPSSLNPEALGAIRGARSVAGVGSMVGAVAGIAVLAFVAICYAWLAIRARRRRLGHSFMGPFEDLWNPAARRASPDRVGAAD